MVAHLDEASSLHSGVFTALYEAHEPYKSLGPVTVLPRVVQSDAAVASRSHAAELGTHIRKTLRRIRAVRIDDREAFGMPAPRPRSLRAGIARKLTNRICAGFKLRIATRRHFIMPVAMWRANHVLGMQLHAEQAFETTASVDPQTVMQPLMTMTSTTAKTITTTNTRTTTNTTTAARRPPRDHQEIRGPPGDHEAYQHESTREHRRPGDQQENVPPRDPGPNCFPASAGGIREHGQVD